MKCPECGTPFTPIRSDQQFCRAACGKASENRGMARTMRLYRDLRVWHEGRNVRDPVKRAEAAASFNFICREIASWRDEDRAAGRTFAKPNRDRDRGHQRKPARV